MGPTISIVKPPETIRVPEVEKGVGCDFDSYLLMPDTSLNERNARAKATLGNRVVILGHHYQRDEVIRFADFCGDSLKLSQQAGQSQAEFIVFCGVHFMAESADILRQPHQKVILPDLNAGCSMADMADIDQVETCWEQLQEVGELKVVPVTYMNSTAAIKAFTGRQGGAVCTSSNAAAVMRWAFERGEKVLFLPDEHLGRNTAYRMGIPLEEMAVWDPRKDLGGLPEDKLRRARVLLWKGYCSVHQRFLPEHVERPIFEADPAAYRNRTAFDADPANPGLAFGPYKVVEVVSGARIVLARNATWWGQKPAFERITVRIIEKTSALEANLLSGAIDLIAGELGLPIDQALAFEKRHGGRFAISYKPGLIYEHLDLNLDNPLLADKRVRKALVYALDRETLSQRLFAGD